MLIWMVLEDVCIQPVHMDSLASVQHMDWSVWRVTFRVKQPNNRCVYTRIPEQEDTPACARDPPCRQNCSGFLYGACLVACDGSQPTHYPSSSLRSRPVLNKVDKLGAGASSKQVSTLPPPPLTSLPFLSLLPPVSERACE
jgi:hypothetical protein